MNIRRITRAASAAMSRPATLTTKVAYSAGAGGSIRASTETRNIKAHWTAFTESMRRMGMPDCPRYAHIPDPGFAPAADDILTFDGEAMLITDVRRSPEGGVYYAGGHDAGAED